VKFPIPARIGLALFHDWDISEVNWADAMEETLAFHRCRCRCHCILIRNFLQKKEFSEL